MLEFNATFIVAMISFVVFILIMNTIFCKPVLSALKDREDYIKGEYASADEFNTKAENINKDVAQKLEAAKVQAREDIKSAVAGVKVNADNALKESIQQIRSEYQEKKDDLYQQKIKVEADIESGVKNDLSEMISSKLLR